MAHKYKSYKVYRVIILNMLAHALNLNIYQKDLEENIDRILKNADYEITRSDIRHEIRSNHKMTEKVLKELESEDLIYFEQRDKKIFVKITAKGIMHLRVWNKFYMELYREQLRDHYRYVGYPVWLRAEDPGGDL